jgi:hypothetical protein
MSTFSPKRPRLQELEATSDASAESDEHVSSDGFVARKPLLCAARRLRCVRYALRFVSEQGLGGLQQGRALCPFSSRCSCILPSPYAFDVLVKHKERLAALGSGCIATIARSLSRPTHGGGKLQLNVSACCKIVVRVASGMAAAEVETIVANAKECLASKRSSCAEALLGCAVRLGHVPSVSLLAWMLLQSRQGAVRGYDLAMQGVHLGCCDCEGLKMRMCAISAR